MVLQCYLFQLQYEPINWFHNADLKEDFFRFVWSLGQIDLNFETGKCKFKERSIYSLFHGSTSQFGEHSNTVSSISLNR